MERIEMGAYYTDGARLAAVVKLGPMEYLELVDCATGRRFGMGIAAFRRRWWLSRGPAPVVTQEDGEHDARA